MTFVSLEVRYDYEETAHSLSYPHQQNLPIEATKSVSLRPQIKRKNKSKPKSVFTFQIVILQNSVVLYIIKVVQFCTTFFKRVKFTSIHLKYADAHDEDHDAGNKLEYTYFMLE